MQMRPIVDRLHAEFGESVAFTYLNAADSGAGQAAFESLSLPGHPGYVILLPDGTESYRGLGLVEETVLRSAIMAALDAAKT